MFPASFRLNPQYFAKQLRTAERLNRCAGAVALLALSWFFVADNPRLPATVLGTSFAVVFLSHLWIGSVKETLASLRSSRRKGRNEPTPITLELKTDLSSGRIVPAKNHEGRFMNHPADEEPAVVFWRTLRITFHPSKGIFASPPRLLPTALFAAPTSPSEAPLQVEWLGHATFSFQWQKQFHVVVDPSFVHAIPFFGGLTIYDRMIEPARLPTHLGRVDLCLISHNHLDHLDPDALKSFSEINPALKILAPEGTGRRLSNEGIPAYDVFWWDKAVVKNAQHHSIFEATCLPAHHSSSGHTAPYQTELWVGWKMTFLGEKPITCYFPGDTSCHIDPKIRGTDPRHVEHHQKMFRQIKEELGPVDLFFWPIDPAESEEDMHLNLDQGIRLLTTVLTDVKKIIPMHYGTWCWGENCDPTDLHRSANRLKEKLVNYPDLARKVRFMRHGEILNVE